MNQDRTVPTSPTGSAIPSHSNPPAETYRDPHGSDVCDRPAILGGSAVRPDGPPAWPLPDPDVWEALTTAYHRNSWGQYCGEGVPALEDALRTVWGRSSVTLCASATLGVEWALRSVGVGPGDEVVMAAYEYEPNFLTLHHLGAKPVLVDVCADRPVLDVDAVRSAVGPTTKAILATHLHGGLVDMPALAVEADRLRIPVVEDAAQVAGAIIRGRPAGSWGDVGVISFGGSKLLSAGRGGAVMTDRADAAQRIRLTSSRGVQQWGVLSELQSAVLVPQIRKLAERTAHRARHVERLMARLAQVPGVTPFRGNPDPSVSAYYKLGFYVDGSAFGLDRERLCKAARAEGIPIDPGFRAIHIGRSAGRYKAIGELRRAESAGQRVVMLHHPILSLGDDDVEQVAIAVEKTYRNAVHLR